jgi:methionyl-tRNA formyltransferase
VACGGTTTLELLEVVLPGRRRMRADAFLHGHHLVENEMLGETS